LLLYFVILRLPPTHDRDRSLDLIMITAEEALLGLRQGGRRLERYVEEFLELANQLSWHDAALGACFQLGLDNETIRYDLPMCEYPLIELINLVLYLNGSKFEVEEIREDYMSRRPAPSGTRRVVLALTSPGTPTYRTNGSDRLPRPKRPHVLQSSIWFLSPEPPAVARSRTPATAPRSRLPAASPRSSPPASCVASLINHEDIMDLALPMGFEAPILSPSPASLLVLSSQPERPPDPAPPEPAPSEHPPERPPEPAPPEHPPVPEPPERPPEPAPAERPPPEPAPAESPTPEHPPVPAPPDLSQACRTLISPKKILGGGHIPELCHGLPDCVLHCGSPSSLLRHGLLDCVLRRGSPSSLIRPGGLPSLALCLPCTSLQGTHPPLPSVYVTAQDEPSGRGE
ncbi:hypothetical protein M9458_053369, partial [Cirrhinus mrigala]